MIECDINWNSGWGNEVIQYCFGRCLGAELDYYVKCPKIRYLKNSGDWNLDGKRFDDPVYEITEHNHKHRTDLDFLKSQTDCKFVVKSFLEYYPFFEKYADEIKNDWMYLDQPYSSNDLSGLTFKILNWDNEEVKNGKRFEDKYYTDSHAAKPNEYLRYPDGWHVIDENGHRAAPSSPFQVGDDRFIEITTPHIHEDDILLNIRLGPDYTYGQFRNRRILSDYFESLLKKIHFRSVFICSEWPYHEILQPLYKYNPIFLSHSEPPEIKTFNFIRLFNKLVITQSSWSWMAGYLSNAKELYFPIAKDGPWSYGPNQKSQWKDVGHDLMVNEDRYIYVNHDGNIIGNYEETRKKLPFPL